MEDKTLKTGHRVIRAKYDDETITVYQAFSKKIALPAVEAQTFISPPFKMERMTWIKPSFLWMMYRSGWGTKENQECILAIKIKHEGFEWALKNSCLSHFNSKIHFNHEDWKNKLKNSSVRIQWDPEKDIFLEPLPYRSIQIGLSGIAVGNYISEWITHIGDVTSKSQSIHQLIIDNKINKAKALLPTEHLYPLSNTIALNINSY